MPEHSKYRVCAPRQLSSLASAARQEIVDVLAEMGTVTVAELARALDRPADALYFHLKVLVKAGLVETVSRVSVGRKQALFRTVAPELWLQYEPSNAANRKFMSAIVASMMRLGVRDFRKAIQDKRVKVSGPKRELWALRKTCRLVPSQVAAVNRAIADLKTRISPKSKGGRLYAITILLTPLDRKREIATQRRSGEQ